MHTITPLENAFHRCGGPYAISKVCGVSNTTALRWKKRGKLPRTEWTGETHYAEAIEAATHGAITKAELLSYVPPQP
jgi:DNA-binding transcriptional regulator YdaS (Cro superfamily)